MTTGSRATSIEELEKSPQLDKLSLDEAVKNLQKTV